MSALDLNGTTADAGADPDFDENEGWAEPKVSIVDVRPSEQLRPSEPFSNEEAREAAQREYRGLREALPPRTSGSAAAAAVAEEEEGGAAAGAQDALAVSLAGFGEGEEHDAWIEGAKLGMTVENVLERTVVHDVDHHGPAVAAGVKKGELLVRETDRHARHRPRPRPRPPPPPPIPLTSLATNMWDLAWARSSLRDRPHSTSYMYTSSLARSLGRSFGHVRSLSPLHTSSQGGGRQRGRFEPDARRAHRAPPPAKPATAAAAALHRPQYPTAAA